MNRTLSPWWNCVCVKVSMVLTSHLLVRQVEQKLPVKASRPPECRVNRVKSVCSTNDHYLPATVQAVHQGQQSGHNRTGQRDKVVQSIYCLLQNYILHIRTPSTPNESCTSHSILFVQDLMLYTMYSKNKTSHTSTNMRLGINQTRRTKKQREEKCQVPCWAETFANLYPLYPEMLRYLKKNKE